MSYRFLKIANFYRAFLNKYYREYGHIIHENYEVQYEHLMAQGNAWANFFQLHLKELGVEAFEIVANATPLQEKWAEEHHTSKKGQELILEQINKIKPDVLFIQDITLLTEAFSKRLRSEFPFIKQIIGFCCSPYSRDQFPLLSVVDYALVCLPQTYEDFTRNGVKSYMFHHGFETSLLEEVYKDNEFSEVDFIFTGSFISTSEFHKERLEIIEEILKEDIDISIYGNISRESLISVFLKQAAFRFVQFFKKIDKGLWITNVPKLKKIYNLNELPVRNEYSKKFLHVVKEPVFGIDMYKAVAKAKIGFNYHESILKYSANVRMFEVTGVGTLLLTDHKKNIRDFFEPDYEIVTFKSKEECIQKVQWLLDNPKKIEEISQAGQKRTFDDHNLKKRVHKLHQIILENFK